MVDHGAQDVLMPGAGEVSAAGQGRTAPEPPTTMRRLYVLRHAKSSWKQPGLADHDRPLAGRGRHAGEALARHLCEQGIEPQLVLCSTALRTRETLERIGPALGTGAVHFERELYGASAAVLLERLRSVPDTVESVMLIGHNPGVQELALNLAGDAPQAGRLAAKYPTAALATFAYAGTTWHDLSPGTADLIGFVRPRDLET
jgi:phosphohistidine phosphatase